MNSNIRRITNYMIIISVFYFTTSIFQTLSILQGQFEQLTINVKNSI